MRKLSEVRKLIRKFADPGKAKFLMRFFKTGKGEYAYGDKFLGLTVPITRSIAKKFLDLSYAEILVLLRSKVHEERLLALILLVKKFNRQPEDRQKIFDIYLKHTKFINNWDLVDTSAPYIIGRYLYENAKPQQVLSLLKKLASSRDLWQRRIAIVCTMYFIRQKFFIPTVIVSTLLLKDEHDLIHKAVGWMLREMGKKDVNQLKTFLKKHYPKMPRTMLRYSIEKFSSPIRKAYLRGRI